jgi:tRNA(adenine34) deaminase
MGALIHARVDRLVYGAADPKTGAAASVYAIGSDGCLNHKIVVRGGVLAEASSALLKTFFKARRMAK